MIDESLINNSHNETKASFSDSINNKAEINQLMEDYERINSQYSDDSQEKVEKFNQILEKLRSFESENLMLSEIISEIENKIRLLNTYIEQDKEIEKMTEKKDEEMAVPNKNCNYHYSVYNKYDDKEEEDFPRLTEKWINKFLCSNFRLYYRTHELNECLYLHFKGFKIIENLDTFTNLKVLYLEGNSIKKIEGLSKLVNLVSLYLHQNIIEKIEGLENLENLYNLNLSDNCITKIENLGKLPKLSNLLIKSNRIGMNGFSDLSGLTELQAINVIDISDNRVDDPAAKDIFINIPTLKVIYLQGNECIRKIPHYRKTMIALIKELRYLDDKPVFDDERRFAEAFVRGGLDEERKERELYRKEKQEAELQRIKDFREMVDNWKGKDPQSAQVEDEPKVDEEKREKEKEDQRMKLLMKCKNKSTKMEIKEEPIDLEKENAKYKNNDIFFNEEDLPNLETVKFKKETGYIDYMMEKEQFEQAREGDNKNNNPEVKEVSNSTQENTNAADKKQETSETTNKFDELD